MCVSFVCGIGFLCLIFHLFQFPLSLSLSLFRYRALAFQSDHQAKIPRFIYLFHLHCKQSYFSITEYPAAFSELHVSGIFVFDFDISVIARLAVMATWTHCLFKLAPFEIIYNAIFTSCIVITHSGDDDDDNFCLFLPFVQPVPPEIPPHCLTLECIRHTSECAPTMIWFVVIFEIDQYSYITLLFVRQLCESAHAQYVSIRICQCLAHTK